LGDGPDGQWEARRGCARVPRPAGLDLFGGVAGLEAHAMVDAETRVAPGAHRGDNRVGDLVVGPQQVEDLFLPELLEGCAVELRKRHERAVGREGLVGDQGGRASRLSRKRRANMATKETAPRHRAGG
jgi:hypothetical protein